MVDRTIRAHSLPPLRGRVGRSPQRGEGQARVSGRSPRYEIKGACLRMGQLT